MNNPAKKKKHYYSKYLTSESRDSEPPPLRQNKITKWTLVHCVHGLAGSVPAFILFIFLILLSVYLRDIKNAYIKRTQYSQETAE